MKLALPNLITASSMLLLIAISQSSARATVQAPQRDNRPRTASISGRVTVDGKPAANASVMVAEVDPQSHDEWPGALDVDSQQRAFIKVRTNGAGRYRVTGLTEGAYLVRALSKAYVRSKNSSDFEIFKSVTLDDSESREDVDIELVRGGVITGRVVDADGGAIIAGNMRVYPVDENGSPREELEFDNAWMMRTDDRGVYRIYGLPAGRYILSADGVMAYSLANRKYPKTFYPDATDQNQAKIIEVKESAEVADIDIRLGAVKNTYEAAGRVIDSETGRPLRQVSVMCVDTPDKDDGSERAQRAATTDDEGRFRVTGLPSGRYDLFLRNRMGLFNWAPASMGNNEHYSEKTSFEVIDSDVNGLEVKAIRGSTISGVVILEGVNDSAVKAKLRQMVVGVQVTGKGESGLDPTAYGGRVESDGKVDSDGAFRLSGAPPGMASFYIRSDQKNIFSISRVERDGEEIKSGIEIKRGDQITGVRIVVANANGTIRGQVEIAGGKLPEGCQLEILALPIRMTAINDGYPAFHSRHGYATADEKGRFLIEGLPAGEYELTLQAMVRVSQYHWSNAPGTRDVKQRVTVSGGVETTVKLTLDLARK